MMKTTELIQFSMFCSKYDLPYVQQAKRTKDGLYRVFSVWPEAVAGGGGSEADTRRVSEIVDNPAHWEGGRPYLLPCPHCGCKETRYLTCRKGCNVCSGASVYDASKGAWWYRCRPSCMDSGWAYPLKGVGKWNAVPQEVPVHGLPGPKQAERLPPPPSLRLPPR